MNCSLCRGVAKSALLPAPRIAMVWAIAHRSAQLPALHFRKVTVLSIRNLDFSVHITGWGAVVPPDFVATGAKADGRRTSDYHCAQQWPKQIHFLDMPKSKQAKSNYLSQKHDHTRFRYGAVSMKTFFLAFAALSTVALAACSSTGYSNSMQTHDAQFGIDESLARKQQLLTTLSESTPVCKSSNGRISYIGPTELGLIECLLRWGKLDAKTLEITSSGGSVPTAIWAAQLVRKFHLDVTVASFCASSCANYIVPAGSRVFILPYSVVSVHGAPAPPERKAVEKQLIASGLAESNPAFKSAVSNNISRLAAEYRIHLMFQEAFGVNPQYYSLDKLVKEDNAENGLLTNAALRSCLPQIQITTLGVNDGILDNSTIDRLFGGNFRYYRTQSGSGICE